METAELLEIIKQLGLEQQNIWSLLPEAGEAGAGLQKHRGGWSLKEGGTILYFSDSPVPGLSGFADGANRCVWADSNYKWSIEYAEGENPQPTRSTSVIRPEKSGLEFVDKGGGFWEIKVTWETHDLQVCISYDLTSGGHWFEENISVCNISLKPVRLINWDFGLTRNLTYKNWPAPVPDMKNFRAAAVPWRRLMYNPQFIQDYDIKAILESRSGQNPFDRSPYIIPFNRNLASEAWAMLNDGCGLLVIKFAPQHLEYSVLRHESRERFHEPGGYEQAREERREHLIFGGSTRCHEDPEPGILNPGEKFGMGLTRYHLFQGDWRAGFDLFKETLQGWGCGLPREYDTYIHWNELYDNKTRWYERGKVLEESKNEHYQIADMKEEAAKAVAFSCETLYMDPGWDTIFASSVWDEKRLGLFSDYVTMIKKEYGLKVALHTPLAAWCDPDSYPASSGRKDQAGVRHKESICAGSRQYLEVKAARLRKLAREGASFLMFDGSFYSGSCFDPEHGHPVPYTRDDHIRAYRWLAEQVHEINPDLKIEMHDLATVLPYQPVYLGFGHGGWDEMWGWEMMWEPLNDIKSGEALSLYYYNLAYDIPIYLHINLKKDNSNGLMLWWYASTCRHLGIGGTHENPETVRLHQKSMRLYRELKPFYVRGKFIGLTETAHLHTLGDQPGGILNLYNLEDTKKTIQLDIPCRHLHVLPGYRLDSGEMEARWNGESISIMASVGAMSPLVVRIALNQAHMLTIDRIGP